MRWSWIVFLVLLAGAADGSPVRFKLQGDVRAGTKPTLEVTAVEPVSDLRVALARDDGKQFEAKHASLAKGQRVALPIGDGALGRASYKGTLTVSVAGKPWTEELTFDTLVRGTPIKVTYDAAHLDLAKHELQFKVSRPIEKAELVVIGEDGKQLARAEATYTNQRAGAWLPITWKPNATTTVMMLKLRVAAADGVATNVELIPWSVTIAHEDVNFHANSVQIEPSEAAKLDASLAKINAVIERAGKFMPLKLYIAGHTDTVGSHANNRKLSMGRANAIGTYFRDKGIAIPVAVAGFGEEVLKVKTRDNTDERANRRADYVIGPATGAPPFGGPYTKVRVTWVQLR